MSGHVRLPMCVILPYAGVATSVSMVLAAAATRLPRCHSFGVFCGVFLPLVIAATVTSDRVLQAAVGKWTARRKSDKAEADR